MWDSSERVVFLRTQSCSGSHGLLCISSDYNCQIRTSVVAGNECLCVLVLSSHPPSPGQGWPDTAGWEQEHCPAPGLQQGTHHSYSQDPRMCNEVHFLRMLCDSDRQKPMHLFTVFFFCPSGSWDVCPADSGGDPQSHTHKCHQQRSANVRS